MGFRQGKVVQVIFKLNRTLGKPSPVSLHFEQNNASKLEETLTLSPSNKQMPNTFLAMSGNNWFGSFHCAHKDQISLHNITHVNGIWNNIFTYFCTRKFFNFGQFPDLLNDSISPGRNLRNFIYDNGVELYLTSIARSNIRKGSFFWSHVGNIRELQTAVPPSGPEIARCTGCPSCYAACNLLLYSMLHSTQWSTQVQINSCYPTFCFNKSTTSVLPIMISGIEKSTTWFVDSPACVRPTVPRNKAEFRLQCKSLRRFM